MKRRKEKNDERKQGNGKTSGVKNALRLKFPEIPSPWDRYTVNTTTNWSGRAQQGGTFYGANVTHVKNFPTLRTN